MTETLAHDTKDASHKMRLDTTAPVTPSEPRSSPPRMLLSTLKEELHITYLFLRSNLGAGVLLNFCSLISRFLTNPSPNQPPATLILALTLKVLLSATAQQYSFDIVNQTASVDEDRIDKPYRPIPAGLVSMRGAYRRWALSWCLVLAEVYRTAGLWGVRYCFAELVLTYGLYVWPAVNHWFFRNAWAAGWTFCVMRVLDETIAVANANATVVAANTIVETGGEHSGILATQTNMLFDFLLSAWVMATVQVQEFHDVEGDRKINRSTLPVVLSPAGNRVLRKATGAAMVLFACVLLGWAFVSATKGGLDGSVAQGGYVSLGLLVSGALHVISTVGVAIRLVRAESESDSQKRKEADERTYKVWYFAAAYCLIFFLAFLNASEMRG